MISINIKEELLKLQDKKYLEFNLKLCPDTKKEMLGIKIPKLREISKKILKEENWKESLNNIDEKNFEETIIKGFIIAYAKISLEEKIEYIKKYIDLIDSWAITDVFIPALKIKPKDLEMFWNFILPYIESNKEFDVRFAIVSMKNYYLTDNYVDKVILNMDTIKHEGYYVKMAVAWTLAEIGNKYNEKLIKYLSSINNLDKFTYNKTLQKMIESYRIDNSQKHLLRKMKKK